MTGGWRPSGEQNHNMDIDPFMRAAIEQAELGMSEGGLPIGSVLIRHGTLLGQGHNRRVQESNPILHAEIDCLQNAGRIGSYADTALYSTLMPCFLCAGAVVQFGIKTVFVGESVNFAGAPELMRSHGVEVIDLDLDVCKQMLELFITENPHLWREDIGEL
jgi:creatinine deaminase